LAIARVQRTRADLAAIRCSSGPGRRDRAARGRRADLARLRLRPHERCRLRLARWQYL